MIFHSIVPIDLVFENSNESQNTGFFEINYMGERVVVSPLTNNQFVINRLISTSPQAYLNPKLQPGTVINGSF